MFVMCVLTANVTFSTHIATAPRYPFTKDIWMLTTRLVPTVVASTFIKVYFIMYLTIYTLIIDLVN